MRIQLIYCGIGVAGFNSNRCEQDREGWWISHGLASIGASLKKEGHEVNLIDLRQLSGFDEFVEKIKNNPCDVYGISISPVDYYSGLMVAVKIKQTFDVPVVVGGIFPSIFPEKFNNKYIDTVVIGEGEITFPKLIKDWNFPKVIQGEKPDLDKLPFVDRELFNYKQELKCNFTLAQKMPSITMLAGRGCPYKCTYCQPAENTVFGKPFRIRSAKNVIVELLELRRYNYESIIFWDDTFTFKKSWVMEFCDLYEQSKIGKSIIACSRADIICNNEDMTKRLGEIGVEWLVIGMESGSQRLLDFIEKGTTVEQNIKSAEICRKYGIKVFATYMYGLPTETPKDSLATKNMINKINPDHASPFFFIPIEGTKIYNYCNDNDLILSDVKNRTIARTNIFLPTLKNIDYDYVRNINLQ